MIASKVPWFPLTLSAAILLFTLGLLVLTIGESSFNSILKKRLPLRPSKDSSTYEQWRVVPIPITNHFYLFNLTNGDDILNLNATPIVKEVGPFVYIEHREKQNITWSPDGTGVSYATVSKYTFDPAQSRGSLDDVICHLNVPLAAAAIFVQSQEPEGQAFFYQVMNELLPATNSSIYPCHTASELLFDGYSDPLIDTASQFFPGMADRFGWFYGRNNTANDGLYEIFTGTDDIGKLGRVRSYKGEEQLSKWKGACNSLEGSTPGDLNPPFQDRLPPRDVRLFVGNICRSLRFRLKGTGVKGVAGLTVNRYEMDSSSFNYSLDENRCYCTQQNGAPGDGMVCPPDGVTNTSTCMFGAPAAISLPHFLHGDPWLRSQVVGMEPDPDRHTPHIEMFPQLGVSADLRITMQINMVLTRDPLIDYLKNMSVPQTYYPMIWFYATGSAEGSMATQLKLVAWLPGIFNALGIFLCLLGAVSVSGSGYFFRQFRETVGSLARSDSTRRLDNNDYGSNYGSAYENGVN